MVEEVTLAVGESHAIENTLCKEPLAAIEELIWNSLDADATNVSVQLEFRELGGIESIRVSDNGVGIDHAVWKDSFGHLGDSPKLRISRTPGGRRMHGKNGKGRLKAFGLGRQVRWLSTYRKSSDACFEFEIQATKTAVRRFVATDPTRSHSSETGVTVEITGFEQGIPSIESSIDAAQVLSQKFCMYLTQYPDVSIVYDNQHIDPTANKKIETSYPVQLEVEPGRTVDAKVTVIEWDKGKDRTVYLCDSSGFARDEQKPSAKTKNRNYSAYVQSTYVDELEQAAAFAAGKLHDGLQCLLKAADDKIIQHFATRDLAENIELIETWKAEKVYPYKESPITPLEVVEQKVFDVCAVNVNRYIPDFQTSSKGNKKLTFRLLREALAKNPTTLGIILREVVSLPEKQQQDLASLLGRTRLSAIINAANQVVGRLRFLDTLEEMLFGSLKNTLNEPRQLHRVLAEEMWIFGEQFHLGADEKSLRNVLKAHIDILGRSEVVHDVKLLDGKDARFDLLLWTKIPTKENHVEHLVIELKRPGIPLGQEEIGQIEKYAFAVARDSRFDKRKTDWKFLLIGNELDEFAQEKCNVRDRAFGHIHAGNPNVHVAKWSSVLAEARWRYEFFRKELALELAEDDALGYLREKHGDLFTNDWSVPKKKSKKKTTV